MICTSSLKGYTPAGDYTVFQMFTSPFNPEVLKFEYKGDKIML